MYRELDAAEIVKTARTLKNRVLERFPKSGLSKVADELVKVAEQGAERAVAIARPFWALRGFSWLLVTSTSGLILWVVTHLSLKRFESLSELIEFAEPAMGTIVFISAALFFVMTLEDRFKRKRALEAIHELRAMAHIVDMHQLTKDPDRSVLSGPDTASSPKRALTPFLLSRYLDYCAELLSIISKIAALYAQHYPDPVAVNAVNELEATTNGLSRKIWQKVMFLGDEK